MTDSLNLLLRNETPEFVDLFQTTLRRLERAVTLPTYVRERLYKQMKAHNRAPGWGTLILSADMLLAFYTGGNKATFDIPVDGGPPPDAEFLRIFSRVDWKTRETELHIQLYSFEIPPEQSREWRIQFTQTDEPTG